jgi:hypothetical protein
MVALSQRDDTRMDMGEPTTPQSVSHGRRERYFLIFPLQNKTSEGEISSESDYTTGKQTIMNYEVIP